MDLLSATIFRHLKFLTIGSGELKFIYISNISITIKKKKEKREKRKWDFAIYIILHDPLLFGGNFLIVHAIKKNIIILLLRALENE